MKSKYEESKEEYKESKLPSFTKNSICLQEYLSTLLKFGPNSSDLPEGPNITNNYQAELLAIEASLLYVPLTEHVKLSQTQRVRY
jgi:hypothetical protein